MQSPRQADEPGLTNSTILYLDLLKKCLTRQLFAETYRIVSPYGRVARFGYAAARRLLGRRRLELVIKVPTALRAEGKDWPADADTMIGLTRLDNLQWCIVDVVKRGVPGDLLEAGVWRGGASIFMRAVLAAYGDQERKVWLADSFQGLPKPAEDDYPADANDQHWTHPELAVPLAEVQARFDRYGLLDDRVRFLPGWFSDTLPTAEIGQLAVLRLDADMYQSTMEALSNLYPKLAVGGYIIIDDYALVGCRAAVEDYRSMHGIDEPIRAIDWTGVFWMKTR